MEQIILKLEWLIKSHVFLASNTEKINILKARSKTKIILLEIRSYLESKVIELGGKV